MGGGGPGRRPRDRADAFCVRNGPYHSDGPRSHTCQPAEARRLQFRRGGRQRRHAAADARRDQGEDADQDVPTVESRGPRDDEVAEEEVVAVVVLRVFLAYLALVVLVAWPTRS